MAGDEKDDRLFAPFDIGMDEHPKIVGLSDAAFRAFIEGTFYSRRYTTDGFLDARIVKRRWGLDVAGELASNDPEKPSWVAVDGGWQIHDFAKHHPLRSEIDAKRAELSSKRAEAGRKGAAKRWQANGKGMANDSSESQSESQPETERLLTKSVSLDVSRENKTDGPEKKSSHVDPKRITELVETVCDEVIDEAMALRLSAWIVERSPSGVRHPLAYTETAIRNDPMQVSEWIRTERAL